ncbi:voltage-gated potassium channel [Catalinimonas alkaloidigena]|uniref:potassium channel family protein n=1 Tax=Catalinimonas alkaloidigena TaxID=1075417 RepID=UPI0024057836|nr:potassium channel protein [Catalinimonas alkaloidigena]MDF9799830.1 voltage-gated potassium channel [Catalinimonas alkaloidigena]
MASKRQKNLLIILAAIAAYFIITYLLFTAESGEENSNIKSLPDAFWYTIVTLTTVGYGDFYPVSTFGRLVGLVFIIGSVSLIGYLISQLTNQYSAYLEKKRLGLLGTNFEHHIIVIGWDKFGKQVVDEVVGSGKQVAIILNNKSEIDLIHEAYSNKEVFVLFTDYSNLEAFSKANIQEAATVFINFTDDTEVLIYLLNLKKKFPDLNYVVSLNNPSLKETFAAAGVRYVVSKTEIASRLVASYTFEPDVALMAESIMTTALEGEEYDLLEFLVNEQNPFAGEDYLDSFIKMKVEHDCVLVGLNKKVNGKRILLKNPSKGTKIEAGDYLVMIGSGAAKNKIKKLFKTTEGRVLERGNTDEVK